MEILGLMISYWFFSFSLFGGYLVLYADTEAETGSGVG